MLASGAEHASEARIEIATGQSDFHLASIAEDFGDGQRIRDDLQGAPSKSAGRFGHRRSAIEDHGFVVLDQVGGEGRDATFLLGHVLTLPDKIEVMLTRLHGHGATVNAAEHALAFESCEIAADGGFGDFEAITKSVEVEELFRLEQFTDSALADGAIHEVFGSGHPPEGPGARCPQPADFP